MQLLAMLIQTALLVCCVAAGQPADRAILDLSPSGLWLLQSTPDGLGVVDLQNQQAAPLVPPKRDLPNREETVLRVTDSGDLYVLDHERVTLFVQQEGIYNELSNVKWYRRGELRAALVIPGRNDIYTHRQTAENSEIKQESSMFAVLSDSMSAVRPRMRLHPVMSQQRPWKNAYPDWGLMESGVVLLGSGNRITATTHIERSSYGMGELYRSSVGPLSRRIACEPDFISARNDVICAILTCNDGVDEGLYLDDDFIAPYFDWKQVEIAADTTIVAGIYVHIDIDGRKALMLQILWDGFISRGIELDLEAPRLRQVTQSDRYPMGLAVVTRDEIFSLSLVDAKPALRKVY